MKLFKRKFKAIPLTLSACALLLATGCVEEGDSFTQQEVLTDETEQTIPSDGMETFIKSVAEVALSDEQQEVLTMAEQAIENATSANSVIQDTVQSAKDTIGTISGKVGLLEHPTNTEEVSATPIDGEIVYYHVNYVSEVDGDTSIFSIKTAYILRNGKKIPLSLKDQPSLLQKGEEITIRSLLINTPEKNLHKSAAAEPFAYEASERADELLSNAKEIVVAYDKSDKLDNYNRNLMYIWVDDKLLSEYLLSEGLAKIAYVNAPNTTYLKQYQQAEAKAKANKLGVWSN